MVRHESNMGSIVVEQTIASGETQRLDGNMLVKHKSHQGKLKEIVGDNPAFMQTVKEIWIAFEQAYCLGRTDAQGSAHFGNQCPVEYLAYDDNRSDSLNVAALHPLEE